MKALAKRSRARELHLRVVVREKALEHVREQIGDLLGDDHDLADRRATLQKNARRVGRKLYAEKPKAFVRRIRQYLDEWSRTA